MGSDAVHGIRIGGVLHDEVEPAAGRLEAWEHALDVAAEDLGALQAPQTEVALGDLENHGVALHRRHGAWTGTGGEQHELGATAQPDEERRRAARQLHHVQRAAPVLALQARPVAGERDGRQRVAARHEPALVALIDDADQPRQRGLRLEDHAPGRTARRAACARRARWGPSERDAPSMITACPVMKRDSSDAR